MNVLSVCSGIGAPECAWHPLGFKSVAFSEIEAFPSAVLAARFPGVPNWGDMTKFQEWPDADVDVIVGGTSCQSFSVSGLRAGLADPRGNLALTYLAVAERYRPEWLVWENVPGVLSSDGGRDFGAILGALGQLGYGYAYRVLDAQFFGVAQRRRRVFVVANARDWRRAAAVLFERESLSGHPAPGRETRKKSAIDITGSITASGGGVERVGKSRGQDPVVPIPFDTTQITSKTNRSNPKPGDPSYTLAAGAHAPAVAYRTSGNCGACEMAVRRLTPTECERLQGFPDGWTAITYRKKPAADGPRYKALGNSMSVPVLGWIGGRIRWVSGLQRDD